MYVFAVMNAQIIPPAAQAGVLRTGFISRACDCKQSCEAWSDSVICGVQIRVNQQDRQLTISGERRQKAAANGDAARDEDAEPATRQRSRERRFGKFKRQFKLAETADLDAVSARYAMLAVQISSRAVCGCSFHFGCHSKLQLYGRQATVQ